MRFLLIVVITVLNIAAGPALEARSLKAQNEAMFRELQQANGLSDAQMDTIRKIFARSGIIGQGNPAITRHPVSAQACRSRLERLSLDYQNPDFEAICGAKFMAPLYDRSTETAGDATVCIDQFEFPDIPCVFPVVWVRAREAAQICAAMGKRLCDAHEWEGACAGNLEPADYRFELAGERDPSAAIRRMRRAHNLKYAPRKRWSYGPEYRRGVCAAASKKSPGCTGGSWAQCGSNTYPAGYFPDCHSAFGVFDINGNAAEHMNLPLKEDQMASRGSKTLGYTEMKGSWFIFDRYRAHSDWCRWRAPFWHGSRVMSPKSHRNYHLGFRCCKTLVREAASGER